jgi:hypothetical protein
LKFIVLELQKDALDPVNISYTDPENPSLKLTSECSALNCFYKVQTTPSPTDIGLSVAVGNLKT